MTVDRLLVTDEARDLIQLTRDVADKQAPEAHAEIIPRLRLQLEQPRRIRFGHLHDLRLRNTVRNEPLVQRE